MTDPVIIERQELQNIVDMAIDRTLAELGIKRKLFKPEISQNQAEKLISPAKLKQAMESGRIRWRKDKPGTKLGRVFINKQDLTKLLNNPTL